MKYLKVSVVDAEFDPEPRSNCLTDNKPCLGYTIWLSPTAEAWQAKETFEKYHFELGDSPDLEGLSKCLGLRGPEDIRLLETERLLEHLLSWAKDGIKRGA